MPHWGGRVGKGIYLASMHSKSLWYTSASTGQHQGESKNKAVMFLVEAALGTEKEIFQDDSSLVEAPKGFDSIVARGRQSPIGSSHETLSIDGKKVLVVPLGTPKQTNVQSRFAHDEYLIYQESQHRVRYVLQFQY